MNPLVFLLGLFGSAFAASGMSSGGSETTASGTVPQTSEDDEVSIPEDEVDGPDDGMDMSGDDGGSSGHSGHDAPSGSDGFIDITEFGSFHGSSSHTDHMSLAGGRTPITTEAMEIYNALRGFLGLESVDMETIGEWAFENTLTNNEVPYGEDLKGVGLYYGMQGAKAGWISDEAFDPQVLADIQRLARQEETDEVMKLVEDYGHPFFKEYLENEGLVDTFVNTLKMEPHYGGWMHGRTHGWLEFDDESGTPIAIAHDLNHLTVLSHDQMQPFMNDTFDWPQWPALDMPQDEVIDYFQSMVTLGDPQGEGIEAASATSSATVGEELMVMLVSEGATVETEISVPSDEGEEMLQLL